ncbi:MAG: hypothetical protein B7Z19_06420 [Polynucleobacter sp. 32-46-5]|nr:MAG: hypothetical protein B7Z19_06420 [Polynucleobacter sp. 32-46-5]
MISFHNDMPMLVYDNHTLFYAKSPHFEEKMGVIQKNNRKVSLIFNNHSIIKLSMYKVGQ